MGSLLPTPPHSDLPREGLYEVGLKPPALKAVLPPDPSQQRAGLTWPGWPSLSTHLLFLKVLFSWGPGQDRACSCVGAKQGIHRCPANRAVPLALGRQVPQPFLGSLREAAGKCPQGRKELGGQEGSLEGALGPSQAVRDLLTTHQSLR